MGSQRTKKLRPCERRHGGASWPNPQETHLIGKSEGAKRNKKPHPCDESHGGALVTQRSSPIRSDALSALCDLRLVCQALIAQNSCIVRVGLDHKSVAGSSKGRHGLSWEKGRRVDSLFPETHSLLSFLPMRPRAVKIRVPGSTRDGSNLPATGATDRARRWVAFLVLVCARPAAGGKEECARRPLNTLMDQGPNLRTQQLRKEVGDAAS
jgi:hypothetical protein